jgi:hypothetical protein
LAGTRTHSTLGTCCRKHPIRPKSYSTRTPPYLHGHPRPSLARQPRRNHTPRRHLQCGLSPATRSRGACVRRSSNTRRRVSCSHRSAHSSTTTAPHLHHRISLLYTAPHLQVAPKHHTHQTIPTNYVVTKGAFQTKNAPQQSSAEVKLVCKQHDNMADRPAPRVPQSLGLPPLKPSRPSKPGAPRPRSVSPPNGDTAAPPGEGTARARLAKVRNRCGRE